MTHEYVLLVGGTVIRGDDEPDATAIAWAEDTIIAIGTDEEVRAVSRGDSVVVDLRGATVVNAAARDPVSLPLTGTLDVGGQADLAVFAHDPRRRSSPDASGTLPEDPLAVIRAGRIVAGLLDIGSPDPAGSDLVGGPDN